MKTRNYEKKTGILSGIIFLLIIELLLFIELKNIKIDQYNKYTMIRIEEKKGYLIVRKKDREILYQNSQFYIENQKQKYKIVEDNQLEENLYQIILETSKERENDIEEISFRTNKISIMEMIINTWGGDKNR